MAKTAIKLEGARELEKLFESFPHAVVKRTRKAGLKKAGARLRTYMRNDAPKRSGELRRSLNSKMLKSGAVTVGLKRNFYYKVLDLNTARGPALAPWFLDSIDKHAPEISQMIISEAKTAIHREAGKAYSRSKSRFRKR